MALNLLRNKYRLLVFDKNKDAVERLVKQGATRASSPAEIAATPGTRARPPTYPPAYDWRHPASTPARARTSLELACRPPSPAEPPASW